MAGRQAGKFELPILLSDSTQFPTGPHGAARAGAFPFDWFTVLGKVSEPIWWQLVPPIAFITQAWYSRGL